MESSRRLVFYVFVVWLLAACASSHVMLGEKRPPISPDQVKLYRTPPPRYEEIAIIEADSSASWAITSQGQMDDVVKLMKEEAAKLGANGILIEGIGRQAVGAVSTGTATAAGNSAYGTGFSSDIYGKAGRGIAIYVPAP